VTGSAVTGPAVTGLAATSPVGAWFDFRNPARWRIGWDRLYGEALDLIALAEQLGFGSAWFSEHHFTDEGYLPSLPAALAAAATRTSRIRLGTGILLAPLTHPLRLAEELAFLDQLSGGRVDVGLAPGYRPVEFEVMGVPKAERGARTNEAIEIMQRAWAAAAAGEPVSYAGRHHSFAGVAIAPPPHQPGGPPLWIGGSSLAAARRAGRYGCHFMPDSGAPAAVYQAYFDELAARGHDAADFRVQTNRIVYVCEDPDEGWRDVRDHYLYVYNTYRRWFAEAGDFAALGPGLDHADQLSRDLHIVGTPEMVLARLNELNQQFPISDLIFWARPPGLDAARCARSLELFAARVLPGLRWGHAPRGSELAQEGAGHAPA
jgi:alkanesulfonate monooxygenase SsuD/methylene tetrahydromethanopterin reductase-like flavin-dependent oxidoreductase (luciferase family)